MTNSSPGDSFSQNGPINPLKRMSAAASVHLVFSFAAQESHEEWQSQLQSLQQLICELLVKNQQLRSALMEAKELEVRDSEGSTHKASRATAP
jgi:hypothetical protein